MPACGTGQGEAQCGVVAGESSRESTISGKADRIHLQRE